MEGNSFNINGARQRLADFDGAKNDENLKDLVKITGMYFYILRN